MLTERFGVPHGRACAAFAASLLDLALERGEERAERFLQVIGAERQLFVRVMDSLAGCGDLRLSEEEIASLRTRLTKVKNYANVPGGFDEDQALALLRRLFGTRDAHLSGAPLRIDGGTATTSSRAAWTAA